VAIIVTTSLVNILGVVVHFTIREAMINMGVTRAAIALVIKFVIKEVDPS